jgi:single-strand DNA-binding protein
MSSFTQPGKLHEIFPTQQVTDKFKKRELVLEIIDGQFTQYAKFQLTQDKCSLLDQFQKGQEVKVSFNLSGKPFQKNGETLYFTNLQAWRIEAAAGVAQTATSQPMYASSDADNDLPF